MMKFENINNNIEKKEDDNFLETKQDLQVNVNELYFQRLLTKDEALIMLDKISKISSVEELNNLEDEFSNDESFFVQKESELVDEFREIEQFKNILDKSIADIDVQNWEDDFSNLLNVANLENLQDYHKVLVKAWLAEYLENVYNYYILQNIDIKQFGERLRDIVNTAEPNLPDFLKNNTGEELGKRKPSFVESIDGTIERYYKIEELKAILDGLADSVIVGGSMSYGPFFNVRKSLDKTGSSDIDAIITLDEDKLNSSMWDKLRNSDIFDEDEKNVFLDRIDKFREMYKNGEVDVLSQKFHASNTDFDISIHFFTPKVFDRLIGEEFKENLQANENKIPILRDYKAKEFPYEILEPQNFIEDKYVYNVPLQQKVDGGVVTELPAYIINDNHFHPGIYQNLVSPRFAVSYDKSGDVTKQVEDFHSEMDKRLKAEWGDNPEAKLLKSHIRNKIFSPILFKS